jgi:hypothetical protein
VLSVFWVALDHEAPALGMEARRYFDHDAAHREDPGAEVQVPDPELGQLAPPQAAFDVGFREESDVSVRERRIEGVELLRG